MISNQMYDQNINSSRSSLTTNSSRVCRIVRKRDTNLSSSQLKSKSKNKQDQCNTSFQEYLTKQSLIKTAENAQPTDGDKQKKQNENPQKCDTKASTLIETISNINLSKQMLIQRGDRYINHRTISKENSPQSQKKRQQKIKKRQPTPVKSKKQISQSKKVGEIKDESSIVFQLQLKITSLQSSLNSQKKAKQKIENQLKQSQKDVKNLRQILSQIEMQNRILLTQKRTDEQKIQNLQKAILQTQNNLTQAQNNLNKLRQTIKQNRITQLQTQIKKVSRQNDTLKQTTTKNQQTITGLTQKLKIVTKQLQELKKFGDIEALALKQSFKEHYLQRQLQRVKKQIQIYKSRSQTQKQSFLQSKIIDQQKQIFDLSQKLNKQQLKLHCFDYFKSKQVQQIKDKSDNQLKALRVRYSKMLVELKNPRKSNKNKISPSNSPSSSPNSKNKPKNSFNIECKCFKSEGISTSQNLNSSLNNKNSIKVLRSGISTALLGANRPSSILSMSNNRNQDNFILQLSPE